jgi:hypothetical protein
MPSCRAATKLVIMSTLKFSWCVESKCNATTRPSTSTAQKMLVHSDIRMTPAICTRATETLEETFS